MYTSLNNLEMFTRALKYCRSGTPGLLRAFNALYDKVNDGDEPDKIVFTLECGEFTLTVRHNAIYDYRVKSWTDVRVFVDLSEEEFFSTFIYSRGSFII